MDAPDLHITPSPLPSTAGIARRVEDWFGSKGSLTSSSSPLILPQPLQTWMWPTINLLFPDIADAMLQYRVKHIPGAFYKATTFTPAYSGAMFPWESATSGTELASAPWGTREDHIGSDIAAAVWAFHLATQDVAGAWLTSTAWPLLQGIASFYMSKIAIDNPGAAADAPLSIRDVMGPDEYADHVTDSCYTNAGVIQTLTHAAAVAQLVGAEPSVYEPWLDAASRIVIVFDAARQYHPESANYSYGTRVKQADTILLGFPFEFAHPTMSAQTRANDLLAYANVSDSNGPAMTQGMFACGFIELGPTYAALAAHFFNLSFANAQPPFAVWTETPKGGATNFITCVNRAAATLSTPMWRLLWRPTLTPPSPLLQWRWRVPANCFQWLHAAARQQLGHGTLARSARGRLHRGSARRVVPGQPPRHLLRRRHNDHRAPRRARGRCAPPRSRALR